VDDVAGAVGYENPAAFRRIFQKLVGTTPAAYRRKFAAIALHA
jgi:transcriptional regulator GlxA family with amidase domain